MNWSVLHLEYYSFSCLCVRLFGFGACLCLWLNTEVQQLLGCDKKTGLLNPMQPPHGINDMGNDASGVPDLHAREASMTMFCYEISSHGALGQEI